MGPWWLNFDPRPNEPLTTSLAVYCLREGKSGGGGFFGAPAEPGGPNRRENVILPGVLASLLFHL